MKLAILALASSLLLQVGTTSSRDLLRLQRPLTEAEIRLVVSEIYQALAGKTFRLIGKFQDGPEILMGRDGFPCMATCPTLSCQCSNIHVGPRAVVPAALRRAGW